MSNRINEKRWDSVWSDGIYMNIWHSNDIIFYIKWFMDTIAYANVPTLVVQGFQRQQFIWFATQLFTDATTPKSMWINWLKLWPKTNWRCGDMMKNMLSDLYSPHSNITRLTDSRFPNCANIVQRDSWMNKLCTFLASIIASLQMQMGKTQYLIGFYLFTPQMLHTVARNAATTATGIANIRIYRIRHRSCHFDASTHIAHCICSRHVTLFETTR